jgi:two-component system response regulator NreC
MQQFAQVSRIAGGPVFFRMSNQDGERIQKGTTVGAYRIVLADEHAMFRQCLKNLLDGAPELRVIGEAGDDPELLSFFTEDPPDMVIRGLSMPNHRWLAVTRTIKMLYPAVKILFLTMHREREYVNYVLAAGAEGYLLKENADTELLAAVEKIRRGECYVSPLVAESAPVPAG